MNAKWSPLPIESTTFEETELIEIHVFNTARRLSSSVLLVHCGVGRLLFVFFSSPFCLGIFCPSFVLFVLK